MFNPTLQSDVGYERPVAGAPAAPSMFEGLVRAASGFIQASARGSTGTDKLREDEEYAIALSSELKALGAAGRPDNPNYRANLKNTFSSFVRKYPQFTSQHSSFMSSQGIEITAPVTERIADAEETGMVEFSQTPMGNVALQSALREVTDENGNQDLTKLDVLMRQARADELRVQASIQSIDRTIASNDQYWRVGESAASALVREELNFAAGLWETIQTGQSVALPPDTAAAIGWTGGEINAKNVALFMNRYRPVLANQIATATRGYLLQNGAAGDLVTEPNADWYTRVMAPIDDIIQAADDQLGDPGKVIEWYNNKDAIIGREALAQTEEGRQILAANAMMGNFDPELRTVLAQTILTQLDGYDYGPQLNRIILLSNTSTPNPTRTDAGVTALSAEQAAEEFDMVMSIIGTGAVSKEKLVGFIDRGISLWNKSKPTDSFATESWNKFFVENVTQISSYASLNSDFAEKVGGFMLSDMQKNWVELQALAQQRGITIAIQDGKVVYSDPIPRSFEALAPSQDARFNVLVKTFEESDAFKAFSTKLQSLGQFGEIGEQVMGVLEPPKATIAQFDTSTDMRVVPIGKHTIQVTGAKTEAGIRDVVAASVEAVLGQGARVVISSGHRPGDKGSQHSTGQAADVAIYTPDGRQLSWNDPEVQHIMAVAAQYGAKGFGAGPNYMGGTYFHVDLGLGGPLASARQGITVWSDDDGQGTSSGGPGAAQWYGTLTAAAKQAPSTPVFGSVGDASTPATQEALKINTGGTTNTLAPDGPSGPIFQSTRTGAPEMAPRAPVDEAATTPTPVQDAPQAVSTEALEGKRYQWRDRQLNQLILSLSEAQGLMQDTYQFDTEEEAAPYLESGMLEDKLVVIGGRIFKVDREQ